MEVESKGLLGFCAWHEEHLTVWDSFNQDKKKALLSVYTLGLVTAPSDLPDTEDAKEKYLIENGWEVHECVASYLYQIFQRSNQWIDGMGEQERVDFVKKTLEPFALKEYKGGRILK